MDDENKQPSGFEFSGSWRGLPGPGPGLRTGFAVGALLIGAQYLQVDPEELVRLVTALALGIASAWRTKG